MVLAVPDRSQKRHRRVPIPDSQVFLIFGGDSGIVQNKASTDYAMESISTLTNVNFQKPILKLTISSLSLASSKALP